MLVKVTHCAGVISAYVWFLCTTPHPPKLMKASYLCTVAMFVCWLHCNVMPQQCCIFYFLHICSQHVHKPLLLPWLPHLSLLRLCRSSDRSVWRSWEPSRVIRSIWYDSMKPTSSISGIRCPSATTVPRSWSTSLRPYQILWRYELVMLTVKWLWQPVHGCERLVQARASPTWRKCIDPKLVYTFQMHCVCMWFT